MSVIIQPPRGFYDLFGEDMQKFKILEKSINEVANIYNFFGISTPIVEFASVFERTLGEETDVVNKEMYTFHDRNDEKITLRPENTAGVVRAFLSGGLQQHLPLRLFYYGPMFRYERPQKGRQRQFHQLGFEILGEGSYLADVDLIALAMNFLKRHIKTPLSLQINTLGDVESRKTYISKIVSFLESNQEKLSADSKVRMVKNPLRVLDSKDENDKEILKSAPKMLDSLNETSKEFFENIKSGLENLGIEYTINTNLVRGLDYYTHTVFEIVSEHLGAQATVIGGGRYNGLVEQMGGKPTPAVGFAGGIERMILLMDSPKLNNPYVSVIPVDNESVLEAHKVSNILRSNYTFMVDFTYDGDTTKRLKRANKLNSEFVIFVSLKGFELKNMRNGEQRPYHNLNNLLQEMIDTGE